MRRRSLQSPRMEQASPVRLYATLVGAGLFLFGIVGFFYDSSFATPDDAREALGLLSVNGWANVFHIITGAVGLFVAGFASRRYAIFISSAYLLIAVAGPLA
jgi:Ni,Fe-hydrogenase I cytochrome b subunit